MTTERTSSYAEFFDFYLMELRHPLCRALHYVGSIAGIASLMLFLVTLDFRYLGAAVVAGYGISWIGDRLDDALADAAGRRDLVEKEQPPP